MCTTVQPHATGHSPVASSLTEDLDLSLRLIAAGGRIRFTDSTFVAQEAVAGIRQLIRQRARWVQGHLVAWEHVGPIQRAHIPLRVRLDLTTFLLLPAALAPIALATVQGWRVFLETLGTQSVAALVGWYLFAFVPHSPLGCYCGMASRYARGAPGAPVPIYGFFWVIAAGRAAWSILRGIEAGRRHRAPRLRVRHLDFGHHRGSGVKASRQPSF